MFVNDVFGLCRSNFLTGDVFGTQIPTTVGAFGQTPFGQTPFTQTPFGCNFTTGNIGAQAYHPLYGLMINRVPQSFVHQGVVPQTFGNVSTLGTQPFLPYLSAHTQFVNPALAQAGLGNIGYGFSPYNVAPWNWTNALGIQSQICR